MYAPPEEWWLSQCAEAFGIPLVQGGAIDQPVLIATRVIWLRSFRDAHSLVNAPPPPAGQQRRPPPGWASKLYARIELLALAEDGEIELPSDWEDDEDDELEDAGF